MLWNLIYQYVRAYLIGAIIGSLIIGIIFAFACYRTVQTKGYPEETCFHNAIGGFFLGIIWMLVVACKPMAAVAEQERISQTENVNYGGMSFPAFLITMIAAFAFSFIGLFVMIKFSWWGLALTGVGLGIFAILYNKA